MFKATQCELIPAPKLQRWTAETNEPDSQNQKTEKNPDSQTELASQATNGSQNKLFSQTDPKSQIESNLQERDTFSSSDDENLLKRLKTKPKS